MRIKKNVLILITLAFFIGLLSFNFMSGNFPVWVYHIVNLSDSSEGLRDPIALDENFDFTKEGFSKSYLIQSKHNGKYEIGVKFLDGITSRQPFTWKFKFEILCNNNILREEVLENYKRAQYMSNSMEKFSSVVVASFDYPVCKNLEATTVRVTVENPDSNLVNVGDLYIALSSSP